MTDSAAGRGREWYRAQLRDPRWQKRAAEIKARDGWRCVKCQRGDLNLQVDHKYYLKNTKPWDYPDDALQTLCEIHHASKSPGAWKLNQLARPVSPLRWKTGAEWEIFNLQMKGKNNDAS